MTGVGLALPQLGPHATVRSVRRFCEEAEALGYSSLWVQDHFAYALTPAGGYAGVAGLAVPEPYRFSLSALELLSAAAAWTATVRLGTSILVAGYHRPAPLAKQLATIDQLSEGRLVVGLGVGWSREEHELCDVDPATRGERIDDFVPALLACWGADPVAYEGPYFTIPPCELKPKPVQRPHPPLISGMWSAPGRRRTARWFDGWNPAGMSVERVAREVAKINAERPDGMGPVSTYHRVFVELPHGRPSTSAPGVDGVVRDVALAAEAGFDEVIVECNFWGEIDSEDAWIQVPERLRPALEAAG